MKKALLVDDDIFFRTMFASMICWPDYGFSLVQADNGPRKNIGLSVPVSAHREKSRRLFIGAPSAAEASAALPEGDPPRRPSATAACLSTSRLPESAEESA